MHLTTVKESTWLVRFCLFLDFIVHTLFLDDNKKNSLFQNVKMHMYFYYSLGMTQTPKLTAKVILENFLSLFVHFETLIYK